MKILRRLLFLALILLSFGISACSFLNSFQTEGTLLLPGLTAPVTVHRDEKGMAYIYAQDMHDGFPPTIIAAVDALSAWGLGQRANQLFRYWLANFVRENGTIRYYGPSISEYGQLLHTAALLEERAGGNEWWPEGCKALDRIAEFLLQLQAAACKDGRLIAGVPEADTRKDTGQYFHNNAWVAKGLRRWADLCQRQTASPTTSIATVRKASTALSQDTLKAIRKASRMCNLSSFFFNSNSLRLRITFILCSP